MLSLLLLYVVMRELTGYLFFPVGVFYFIPKHPFPPLSPLRALSRPILASEVPSRSFHPPPIQRDQHWSKTACGRWWDGVSGEEGFKFKMSKYIAYIVHGCLWHIYAFTKSWRTSGVPKYAPFEKYVPCRKRSSLFWKNVFILKELDSHPFQATGIYIHIHNTSLYTYVST